MCAGIAVRDACVCGVYVKRGERGGARCVCVCVCVGGGGMFVGGVCVGGVWEVRVCVVVMGVCVGVVVVLGVWCAGGRVMHVCWVWKCLWMGGCVAVGAGVEWDVLGGGGGVGKGVCRGCARCGRVEWRCVCIGCLYAWCVCVGWHVWVGCVRLCGGAICGGGGGACMFVWVCSGVCRGHVGLGWGLRVCVWRGACRVRVWECGEVGGRGRGGGGDVHICGVRIGVVGVRSFVCAAYVWWGV